jgi:predicted Zn-dependent protease
MALHANNKTLDALEMLKRAIAVDPRNPLARYQKAIVLIAMRE